MSFSREPLRELIERIRREESICERKLKIRDRRSYEHIGFIVILLVFLGGLFYNGFEITGKVVREEGVEGVVKTIEVNQVFREDSTFSFIPEGNVSTIRLTGQIIGRGRVKVLVGDITILYSDNLPKKDNLLTGMVVKSLGREDISEVETQESEGNIEEGIVKNVTDDISYTLEEEGFLEGILDNETEALTDEIDNWDEESLEESLNYSYNLSDLDNSSGISGLGDITEYRNSLEIDNVSIDGGLEITEFSYYCDSCNLDLNGEIILSVFVENAVLNLSSIIYTYSRIIEGINETSNLAPDENLNITIEQIIEETGVIEVNYTAVINEPVLWRKVVNVSKTNKTILPKQAFNISVSEVVVPKVLIDDKEYEINEFNEIQKLKKESIAELKEIKDELIEKDKAGVSKLSEIKGKANLVDVDKDLVLSFEINKTDFEIINYNFEIKYYTDAPVAQENIISDYRKQITISSELHYENVLAYTNVKESKKESIRVYWLVNSSKILMDNVDYIDTNDNGLIDKIEWIVPHLSNQTFEISLIVLNPITYLRDGETWVVAFNTTGKGNLTISSTNAAWTEFFEDDPSTADEMTFLSIKCGDISLVDSLRIIKEDGSTRSYASILPDESIRAEKLVIPDYECPTTSYLSNYMHKAGYAILLFEFSDEQSYVKDFAYDPQSSWCYQEHANVSVYCGGLSSGGYSAMGSWANPWQNATDGNWVTYAHVNLDCNITDEAIVYVNYSVPRNALNTSRWQVLDKYNHLLEGDLPKNFTISSSCWNPDKLQLRVRMFNDDCGGSYFVLYYDCWNGTFWTLINETTAYGFFEEAMIWDVAQPQTTSPVIIPYNPTNYNNLTCSFETNYSINNITNWYVNNASWTLLYMPFEAGSNNTWTKDYSGYNSHGTVSGATYLPGGGRVGGAYSFDGVNDYIQVPGFSSYTFRHNFSIELWVYARTYGKQGGTSPEPGNSNSSFLLFKNAWLEFRNNGNLEFITQNTTFGTRGVGSTLSVGQWTHVVGTYDRTTGIMSLYKDGQLVDNETDAGFGDLRSDQTLLIGSGTTGSSCGSNGCYFDGIIDEVKIYNRTLSPEQVSLNYLQGYASLSQTVVLLNETKEGEEWFCSVVPTDGNLDGDQKNSSKVFISGNAPPTHSNPVVLPEQPRTIDNLTCQATGVFDFNNDPVINITAWYVMGNPITSLYMPFEGNGKESSNATDYSGHSNNGTVIGAAWNRTGGRIGGAYSFNQAGDHIFVQNSEYLNISGAGSKLTIEFWFKVNTVEPTWQAILYKGNSDIADCTETGCSDRQYFVLLYEDRLYLGSTPVENMGVWQYGMHTSRFIQPGAWYHAALVIDSVEQYMRIYVNGTQMESQYYPSSGIRPGNGSVFIGSNNVRDSFFNGTLDELKIYNISLSAEQIAYNHQAGRQGNIPNRIVNQETAVGENWSCSVTPNDGYADGDTKSSSQKTIVENVRPTHGTPYITPDPAGTNVNLTCNWNNVTDIDGDEVVNITVWHRGGRPFSLLHMPFEGNGNEGSNATDYSGYGQNGTVSGAVWNRTGGKIGGGYEFFGNLTEIYVADSERLDAVDSSRNWTVMLWYKSYDSETDIRTLLYKGDWKLSCGAYYGQNTCIFRKNSGLYPEIVAQDNSFIAGRWQHIALIGNGNSTRISFFIDGVNRTQAGNNFNYSGKEGALRIGFDWDDFSWYGMIDELKIFNHSLSKEQVIHEYLEGLANRTAKTVVANETKANENWHCAVTPNDGYGNGITKNSSHVFLMSNLRPTHDTPYITPVSVAQYHNLTCNWNNVLDSEGDPVQNITVWTRNDGPLMRLYMPFEGNGNESTNATDYSGYGHNGTVFGAAWNKTGGKIGGGYVFNGASNYILVPDKPELRISNQLTLEAWVYQYSTGTQRRVIHRKQSTTNSFYYLALNNGIIEFRATDCSYGSTTVGTYAIPTDRWFHIAATFDDSLDQVKFYVNGTLVQTSSGFSRQICGIDAGDVEIGGHSGHTRWFHGMIDEVRIYNYTLSGTQLKENYLAGVGNRTPNKIASNETSAGERWVCSVTPNDGYGDGITKNSTAITVSSSLPTIVNATLIPRTVFFDSRLLGNQYYISANVTGAVISVNFTIVAPNGTKVISNANGSASAGIWNSSLFRIDQYGLWLYNVTAWNSDLNFDNYNGSIGFIQIRLNVSPSISVLGGNLTVSGRANDSSGMNITGERVYIYLNDSLASDKVDWLNVSWLYRKTVNITEQTGEDLQGFQVNLSINTSSLISAGKMRADCSDILFSDKQGNLLWHFLESGCNTTSTKVWLRVNLTAFSTTQVYMYYGNPGAGNRSNGTNTFDFYDDFSGSSIDYGKWNTMNSGAGTAQVSGGYLNITSSGDWYEWDDTSFALLNRDAFSGNFIAETYVVDTANFDWQRIWALRSSNVTNAKMAGILLDSPPINIWAMYRSSTPGLASFQSLTLPFTEPFLASLTKNHTTIYFGYNGSNFYNVTGISDLNYIALTSTHSVQNLFGWVRVRKFAEQLPVISHTSDEEASQAVYTDSVGNWSAIIYGHGPVGVYVLKVNISSNGKYGEQSALHEVQQDPVIKSHWTEPSKPVFNSQGGTTFIIRAEVADDNLVAVNFTLIAPNGSKVINNLNATAYYAGVYNSSEYTISSYGKWNYSLTAWDGDGNSATAYGSIAFLEITLQQSKIGMKPSANFSVWGRVNNSQWKNVSNEQVYIYLNGSLIASKADWFNTTWIYRIPLNITEQSGEYLQGFQVNLSINSSALIASGKMRADCSDILFSDKQGNLLWHFLESGCNTTSTKVWLRVNLTAFSTTQVYMYYGNPGAGNRSNGTNTFDFYDDFSGSSIDYGKWNTMNSGAGTAQVSGGYLNITSSGDWYEWDDTSFALLNRDAFSGNFIAETYVVDTANFDWQRIWALRSSNVTNAKMAGILLDSPPINIWAIYRSSTPGLASFQSLTLPFTEPFLASLTKNHTTIYFGYNGSNFYNVTGISDLNYIALTSTHSVQNLFGWVRVRKFAEQLPIQSAIGNEETAQNIRTDADGNYAGNFSAPLGYGVYQLVANATHAGEYGEERKSIIVSDDETSPIIGIAEVFSGRTYLSGSDYYYAPLVRLRANVSDEDIGIGWCYYSLNNGTTWIEASFNSTHCYTGEISPTGNITIRFNATDWAGNSAVGLSRKYLNDSQPPECSLYSITTNSSYVYATGSTVYYSSHGTGVWNVTVSASDSLSGMHNVTFPSLSTITGSGADTSAPYRSMDVGAYAIGHSSTFQGGANATCSDNLGNLQMVMYSVQMDLLSPYGGSVSYQNGENTSNNAMIFFSMGSDDGSGISVTRSRLLRTNGTVSGVDCLGLTKHGVQIGITGLESPYTDSSTQGGKCYQYRYEVWDNVNNGVNYTSSNILKITSTPPNVTSIYLSPLFPNTTSNIGCWATAVHEINHTLNFEWWWYNSSSLKLWGNTTGVQNGTNALITSLGNGNTSRGESWNCTLRAFDGQNYSNYRSASAIIVNALPVHSAPTILPSLPNLSSNLSCNWNNVFDADGDEVVNITVWHRGGRPFSLLHMPFEGNGNEGSNATDYSGYGQNGTVSGAVWNRTGGKIGGGYEFFGNLTEIYVADSERLDAVDSSRNWTVMLWYKSYDSETDIRTLLYKGDWKLSCGAYYGQNTCIFRKNSGLYPEIVAQDNSFIAGRWQHIALIGNGNSTRISFFIDGVNRTQAGDNFNYSGKEGALRIGFDWDDFSWYGMIDELKIFNHSLSKEQVIHEYLEGLANRTAKTVVANETKANENWHCAVTPNDGYADGLTKNSTMVTIGSSPPAKVILLSPTKGNVSVWSNPPTFIWQNTTDIDNDALQYQINITSPICADIGVFSGITALNYTPSSELVLNCLYEWEVRAYDGTDYGEWSEKWNFTIEPVVILTMVNSSIDFGELKIGSIADTDRNASPFVVRNDGNVRANITYVSINASLWQSVSTNTEYFQFKVDNLTAEPGSFNWSASTTNWTNLTLISDMNKTAVVNLNYQDNKDEAEIDIRIVVPSIEPPGTRRSTVYIIGEEA